MASTRLRPKLKLIKTCTPWCGSFNLISGFLDGMLLDTNNWDKMSLLIRDGSLMTKGQAVG
jgi:hypothetical protein